MSQTDFKPVKRCFGHIGGQLGILLMETFAAKGWIAPVNPSSKHFYITELGTEEFTKMGLDLSQIESDMEVFKSTL